MSYDQNRKYSTDAELITLVIVLKDDLPNSKVCVKTVSKI